MHCENKIQLNFLHFGNTVLSVSEFQFQMKKTEVNAILEVKCLKPFDPRGRCFNYGLEMLSTHKCFHFLL